MGLNLKDIFHDNEDELVVNRSKNAIRALIIMCIILLIIIIVASIIKSSSDKGAQRRSQIIQDTKIVRDAVEILAKEYKLNPSSTELIGMSLNDNPQVLIVNGVEEEYRYGYYLITPESLNQLTNTVSLKDQYYIVNYDTYDVVNYYGVEYNNTKYYAIDDLLMIEKGMQPIKSQVIRTVADLEKMRMNPNGSFKLSANLDLSLYNTGEGWKPIEQFSGILDGRGYTISNLTISRSSTDRVGFFGKLTSTAKIANITFENAKIRGGEDVGVLAGDGAGTITNVYVRSGDVIGQKNNIGGLVGAFSNGSVSNCRVALNSVNGNESVGGLVGNLINGTISRSSTAGLIVARKSAGGAIGLASASSATYIQEVATETTITGSSDLGGIVGKVEILTDNILDLSNSYAKGAIEARNSNNTGGLIGSVLSIRGANIVFDSLYTTVSILEKGNTAGGCIGYTDISSNSSVVLNNCFWEKDLAPGEELQDIGGRAKDTTVMSFASKTPDEMRIHNTFAKWNFDIWGIIEREDTPYLKWQH